MTHPWDDIRQMPDDFMPDEIEIVGRHGGGKIALSAWLKTAQHVTDATATINCLRQTIWLHLEMERLKNSPTMAAVV
jgi:hypothetical protein